MVLTREQLQARTRATFEAMQEAKAKTSSTSQLTQSEINRLNTTGSSGRRDSTGLPQKTDTTLTVTNSDVQLGGKTFVGKAEVTGTGFSADELVKRTQAQAKAQGITGRFESRVDTAQPSQRASPTKQNKFQQAFTGLKQRADTQRRQQASTSQNTRAERFKAKVRARDVELAEKRQRVGTASFVDIAKSGDLPAVVQKASQKVGGALLTVSEKITGQTATPSQKIEAQSLVGESLLIGGLGKVAPTTTQIMRNIQPVRVAVAGTTKQSGSITDITATYKTSRGGKGIIKGVSVSGNNKAVSTSVIKESTKVFGRKGKTFGSLSVSASKNINGGLTKTISTGNIAQVTKGGVKGIQKFIGGTISAQGSRGGAGLSSVFTKTGKAEVGTALFKRTGGSGTRVILSSGGGQTQISTQALKSIADAVASTQIKPIQVFSAGRVIPIASIQTRTPTISSVAPLKTKTLTTTTTIPQVSYLKPKSAQILTTSIKAIGRQRTGLFTGSSFAQTSAQTSTQKIATIPVIKSATATKIATSPALKSSTYQTTRTISPLFPFPPTTFAKPIGAFRLKFKPTKRTISSPGNFGVSIRRYGKFRTIGSGLSLRKAVSIGTGRVARTLGATFKITPQSKNQKIGAIGTPKGFKRKKGLIFIEQPKFRLSTLGETKSIQLSKKGIKI